MSRGKSGAGAVADISACTGQLYKKVCPKRKSCYRYICEKDVYRQSYMAPDKITKNGCEYYWKVYVSEVRVKK